MNRFRDPFHQPWLEYYKVAWDDDGVVPVSPNIPNPCIVMKKDWTYDARDLRRNLRANGRTREEALENLKVLRAAS